MADARLPGDPLLIAYGPSSSTEFSLNQPRIHRHRQVVLKHNARDLDLSDRDRTREPYLVKHHPLSQVVQTNSRPAHSAANLQLQPSRNAGNDAGAPQAEMRALLFLQKENQCQES
jgi:hypothetical protein